MAVSIGLFDGATAAPPVTNPVMITAGDSLVWGEGLQPEHRFREIVRARLEAQLGQPVAELSMARCGAQCTRGDSDPRDDGIVNSLRNGDVVPAIYNASGFVRELASPIPTTIGQLRAALGILSDPTNASDPADILLILLDGGINDTGIVNILTPAAAISEGGLLASWEAWLFARATDIRDEMIETLRFALENFPNAAIVVNGYYPIFSMYSTAMLLRIQAMAAIYFVPGVGIATPLSIAAAASASLSWQVATNRRLREAITTIQDESPGRDVLFARSGIEGPHCLFAPLTMLWDYDGQVDTALSTDSTDLDVAMILAGITPQDEVAVERRAAVADAEAEGTIGPMTVGSNIMGSVGHPNVAGAQDYAASITDALEFAGILSPSRPPCEQADAARRRACQDVRDRWDFEVMRVNVEMDAACTGAANGAFDTAGAALNVAGAAWDQLTDRPAAIAECYSTTETALEECAATEAAAIAACNAALAASLAGPCDITCTNFMGCNAAFGAFDPRRYVCQTARAACVAAAAVARTACRVGAEGVRAVCVAGAVAAGVTCRAGVVAADTACAAGQVVAGVGDVAVAAGAVAVAGGIALGGVGIIAGCRLAQGVVRGVGGLIGWTWQRGCEWVSGVGWLGCRLASALTAAPAAGVPG